MEKCKSMTAVKRSIGEQVKEFRLFKGWNTSQMAKAVGTSRQNIEMLESNPERTPRYMKSVAKCMGVTVDELLGGLLPAMPTDLNSIDGRPVPVADGARSDVQQAIACLNAYVATGATSIDLVHAAVRLLESSSSSDSNVQKGVV